jgi:hypothetical protein
MPIPPNPSTRLQRATPTSPQLPELLRMEEVAKTLCTTERHLRQLIAERRIPFVVISSASTRPTSRDGSLPTAWTWSSTDNRTTSTVIDVLSIRLSIDSLRFGESD